LSIIFLTFFVISQVILFTYQFESGLGVPYAPATESFYS